MKYLIYELFSGVGFCNQLFSLETAIYLANITDRKLILLVRNPLCHCGRASWDYGKFLDFFSDDYKIFLPHGLEVYYGAIPSDINKILQDNNKCHHIKYSNRFSQIVIVDKNLDSSSNETDIKNFLGQRNKSNIDVNDYDNQYIFINQSNASRCFYNFYTTLDNYKLMSNICYSLTKLNIKFYKIIYNTSLPDSYISIHLRLGDVKYNTNQINITSKRYTSNIETIIKNFCNNNETIVIMCDRKDADLLDILKKQYTILFSDLCYNKEMIKSNFTEIKNLNVVKFLCEKIICEKANTFIGYENSTVSNHINYVNFLNNKPSNIYTSRILKHGNYSWNINNSFGGSIGFSLFFKDNIYNLSSKYYIKFINEKYVNKKNKKIISFCLYGIKDERNLKRDFLKGLYVNYELAKTIYPGWICRVYIPITEPKDNINQLLKISDLEVILVDTNICLRTLRFLPYDDKDVDIWISRDLDSVLNWRERRAVDEWMLRDEKLHIMSDNHQHVWKVACGMFGIKNDYKINFQNEIIKLANVYNNQNEFDMDAKMTENIFYNNYKHSYIQHFQDGKRLDNSFAFPKHESIESSFVGNIVNINKYFNNMKLNDKYKLSSKIKLFNMDLHISVIADIKDIFEEISKDIEIIDWSISDHTWVFNRKKTDVKIINSETWKKMDMKMIADFHKEYDDFLNQFDGFIVTHTPVFCMLFEKYNKPIFMINSCRYVQPYCWQHFRNDEMMNTLNISLRRMWDNKQLIAISNNKGDQRFLELGTGIVSSHLPSLCLYTNSKYNPIKENFIVMGTTRKDLLPPIENVVYKDDLGGRYYWKHLYQYKAIIILPYEISTMSIFEYYSANVPLIFPSSNFFKELIKTGKYPCIGSRYFQFQHPECFNDALNGYPGINFLNFWLDKADYYDSENMPHILYYDSFDELKKIIIETDFKKISETMKLHNINRIQNVLKKYKDLLKKNFDVNYTNSYFQNSISSNICELKKPITSTGFRTGYQSLRNQLGIEEYLTQQLKGNQTCLEIGCGGGQWSKHLYPLVKSLHCTDILSCEHNKFWQFVGVEKKDKITYHTVNDTLLTPIANESQDYVFTYDVFCHLSLNTIDSYLKNLYEKCKSGCKLLVMYADVHKFLKSEPRHIKNFEKEFNVFNDIEKLKITMLEDCDGKPRKGRWYWIGIDNFVGLCEKHGFTILERDLNIDKTNPLTLFIKK